MTHIYYTFIDQERHNHILSNFSQDFSKVDEDKIVKFWKWQDAQLSMLGKYLLRYGLKKMGLNYNYLKVIQKENAKPCFETENIFFNISHSENTVICAISDSCEMGIDIENIRDITISDFKSQMTENEWKRILDADNMNSLFFDYWTQKEAVLKAHGCGIIDSLQSFEINKNHTLFKNHHFFLKELSLNKMAKCYLAFKDKMDTKILKPEFIESFRL